MLPSLMFPFNRLNDAEWGEGAYLSMRNRPFLEIASWLNLQLPGRLTKMKSLSKAERQIRAKLEEAVARLTPP